MASNEISQYVVELNRIFQTGRATEHSYRPALQKLLENIVKMQDLSQLKALRFTNEPKRGEFGAPDYIVTRNDIPIGYIEAKDIGIDLNGKASKEQFDRYKQSLDNIIFADYLDFHYYVKGEFVDSVRIAEIKGNKISPINANFGKFEQLIKDFGIARPQGITSPADIAQMMARKARLMAEVIEKVLDNDDTDNALIGQMEAFKEVLIKEITKKEFADVYAQTIAYGLFAARLHDESPDTFNRQKAANLIPKTNPFLRQLFQNIAAFDLDKNIRWIVDDLADTFRTANMFAFKKEFGEHTQQNDPLIHFYEDFLSAYDPALRKSRGVWYTPQAVVTFIVRAVDEILQKEFKLQAGLADTSKTKIKVAAQDGKVKEIEVHKVQILDPATGTGTFLAETVRQIHEKFSGQGGVWQSYVEKHLIPRLNGFELLMASYTMAHIKLEQLLTQTGYEPQDNRRLRVYLTNSLEEHYPDTGSFFAQFLAREANEANSIKRDTPVMVVLGNPPYSVSSSNKGEWINELLNNYKQGLNEKNIQPLSDDYIKFIRYGQHYIEKNGSGILAYISNNSFIDGLIHRRMRKNLLETFDTIYILDLHGNSKKKETCPDGSSDQNVFDIMQGVSINIFVKTSKKKKNELGKLFHYELFGKRDVKYEYLLENTIQKINWQQLEFNDENYFFVPKDFSLKDEYEKGFKVDELFPQNQVGVGTYYDANLVSQTAFSSPDNHLYNYRPFDIRFINYDLKKVKRARYSLMQHFLNRENIGLCLIRNSRDNKFSIFVCNKITDKTYISFLDNASIFPLYRYPENHGQQSIIEETERVPNLNKEIVSKIRKSLGKAFEPIDLFDYIYAVLHSPCYREKYKEFLKIDFPRVPYPENAKQFRKLVKFGEKLRKLHLLEDVEPQQGIADYPISGSDEIEKLQYENGKVWINSTQYFANVPSEAWEFYIGGYQPAQKWLKDRKGRKLEFEDIQHYRRIVWVLLETGRVMGEINGVGM